ncbi:O-antigen ligase family protein [Galactobacillus timonensis]|uniref:O-antigen ligase family protein n=1 Tax=Galactobacillus timonensis TaxID=2041840 RepID=UPI0024091FAD|nr:O-antigen ligase family protein [Galactobacillus timonensis]MDD6369792.1 O-antigen ligase family protein [Galactobacillus timonensis]
MDKEKTFTTQEKWLHRLILILITIQPLIDLDYLVYDWLNQYGLPRPSTVMRFVILPVLIIAAYFVHDKNKKRTGILAGIYAVLFVVYFYLHDKQAAGLVERLDFTDNFQYSRWGELTYCLTLLAPVVFIYAIYHEHFSMKELKNMALFESGIISVPIVLGDLYVFGVSTYYGNTVGNIFTWFDDIYQWYHPRTLASKFFFNEGNTIGILLFMILPLLYYFFSISETKKEKRNIFILIVVQSFAMQMLATRVATYGAVVVPGLFLVLYALDHLFVHKAKMAGNVVIGCLSALAVFALLLPRTPAVENQHVDAVNDTALLHNGIAAESLARMEEAKDLIPGTPEYINFYVFMFEAYGINGRYIQSVPSQYYTKYYSYQHDPKFWVDVMNMDVYDRVNGRQIETIFTKYKYQNLTMAEKILGMGYSTFNAGSIVLERDFVMQVYLLGYAGELLLLGPWVALILYGVVMFLKYHREMLTLENVILAVSLGAGMGSAYLSGHMLDQFVTTVFAALLTAILLNHIAEAKKCHR